MKQLDLLLEAVVDRECENYKPGFESLDCFKKRHKMQLEHAFAENLEFFKEGIALLRASEVWEGDDLSCKKGFDVAFDALEAGKVSDAKKMFMALAQLNPEYFQFSEGLGYALVEEGRYEEALVAFQTAMQLSNEEEVYRLSLLIANMLALLGHVDKAREAAEAIIEQIGDNEAYTTELQGAKDLLK